MIRERSHLFTPILTLLTAFCMLPGSGDEARIDSLRKVNPSSPGYAQARLELASSYLRQQTVRGRRLAATTIEEALREDRGNLSFHTLKIRILYEQGFYRGCEQACNELLRISPPAGAIYNKAFSEAYYYKGLIAERSALKYKDMVSFVESNVLDLGAFGIKDLLRAAANFEKAIVYDASHRDAIFHLALLYYEIKSYDKMALFFDKLMEEHPLDFEVFCFAGLANYHAGRFDRSHRLYLRALQLMDDETRSIFEDLRLIVPRDEQKVQVDSFYRVSFWRKKDPLLLTEFNERQLEHYNRLTYAHLRFSVPKPQIPGWKTDRGVIYIRYGEPVSKYKVQPDEKFLGGRETWIYRSYSFTFDDEYASGHYQLDQPSYLSSRSAYNTVEETYALPTAHTFDLAGEVFQFRNSDGSTTLRAYYSAPAGQVDPTFDDTGFPVRIQEGLFLVDNLGRALYASRRSRELSIDNVTDTHFATDATAVIGAEAHKAGTVVMEWLVEGDQRFGVYRRNLTLRDFSGGDLMISDLVTGTKEVLAPWRISRYFRNTDLVHLYFEIYNLTLNNDPAATFAITASLLPAERTGLTRWLTGGAGNPLLSSTFDGHSVNRDEPYELALNIRDVPDGRYRLEVRVEDLLSGRSVSTFTLIQVHSAP